MHVLILGGTTEASALAWALATDPRYAPVLSLAGRTSNPRLPPIPVRIGGFGGAAGLAEAMRAMGTAALIDATHPFAARISANAVLAAAETGVPLLAICRPEWVPGEADRWTMLPDLTAAAAALGDSPRRVLLIERLRVTPGMTGPEARTALEQAGLGPVSARAARKVLTKARVSLTDTTQDSPR